MTIDMRTACVVDTPIPMDSPSLELDWRSLYRAAIFEDDKSKIVERIAAAEYALRANAGLLADNYENLKELRDMEKATYFLKLLGNQGRD